MAKKKWGDRKDGIWLKDIPAMNRIMAPLMPNRADNEAHISVEIDARPLNAYLEKLNEGRTEDKYTFFHLISAAIGKAFIRWKNVYLSSPDQCSNWQGVYPTPENEPVCMQS